VPKSIVNFLEMIKIEQKHGQGIAISFGSRNFLSKALFTEAAIVIRDLPLLLP
jgi:hypothetical protein